MPGDIGTIKLPERQINGSSYNDDDWSGLIVIRSSKLAITSPPSIVVTRLVYLAFDMAVAIRDLGLRDAEHKEIFEAPRHEKAVVMTKTAISCYC